MVILPTRIFNNTYAKFEVGSDYFGINLLQRTYLTLSEVDILQCRGEDIMICPANQAVYGTEVNSCALSLYSQSPHAREVCKRTVTTRPSPPILERHGAIVIYHLTEPKRLHLQCRHKTWETYTMILEGGGTLQNAESCYLTLPGMQLYPAMRGESVFHPESGSVHPYHPSSSYDPREGSPTAVVPSERDKSGAAVYQHFFASHRSRHQYPAPPTCFSTPKCKQK